MRTVFLLLSAVAVLLLPRPATADDDQAKGPGRPGMDMLMKRLDTNQDGAITKDEVPERAPEFLKAMLKQADKDGDGKVTREELAALRPMGAPERTAGPPRGPGREGRPEAAPSRGPRREGRPKAAPPRGLPKPPSAEAIFKRLDKDGDGKLTLEEFSVGVKAAQAVVGRLASYARATAFRRPGPPAPSAGPFARGKAGPPSPFGRGLQAGPPHGRRPGPPPSFGRGAPHFGPPKAGPPQLQRHGAPHFGPPKAGPPGRAPFGPPKAGVPGRGAFGPPMAGPPGRAHFGPPKAGPPHGRKPGPPEAGKPGPKKSHQKRGDKDDDDDGEDDD